MTSLVTTSCNGLKIQLVTRSIRIWIDLLHFPVEEFSSDLSQFAEEAGKQYLRLLGYEN